MDALDVFIKTTRVNRTGSAVAVIERKFERARESYDIANKRIKQQN